MSRILIAVPMAILLATAVVHGAPAKQAGSASEGQPRPGDAVVEATATGSAAGQGSTATATATCPSGTKVAGGGFDAPFTSEVIGLVHQSARVRKRGWRVSVQLLDPGETSELTVTAYAYCRPHLPSAKTHSSTVPTTGETELGPTVAANCGSGGAPLAGGFAMPPPLRGSIVTSLFFDSLRSGDGWATRVVTGPAAPSSVTSEAYCTRRGDEPVATSAASPANGKDFSASAATAGCPAGLSPAAGGFSQPDGGLASFFIVYESRRVGDAWRVAGLHSGNSPAVALIATAYCS